MKDVLSWRPLFCGTPVVCQCNTETSLIAALSKQKTQCHLTSFNHNLQGFLMAAIVALANKLDNLFGMNGEPSWARMAGN